MKTDVKTVAENEVLLTVEVPHDEVKAQIERTVVASAPGDQPAGLSARTRAARGHRAALRQRLHRRPDAQRRPRRSGTPTAVIEAELDPVSSPEVDFDDFTGEGDFAFTAKFQVRPERHAGRVQGRRGAATGGRGHRRPGRRPARDAAGALRDARPGRGSRRRHRRLRRDRLPGLRRRRAGRGRPGRGLHAPGRQRQPHPGLRRGARRHVGRRRRRSSRSPSPTTTAPRISPASRRTFTVALKEIKEKVVPPLDDELAKQASEFDTLDELRAFMRERIEEAMAAERRARVPRPRHGERSSRTPRSRSRRRWSTARPTRSTTSSRSRWASAAWRWRSTSRRSRRPHEEVEDELQPRAEAIVKQGLVIAAVRDAEQIEVGDDEVREYLTEEAQALERDATQHILEPHKAGRQDDIRAELVMAEDGRLHRRERRRRRRTRRGRRTTRSATPPTAMPGRGRR